VAVVVVVVVVAVAVSLASSDTRCNRNLLDMFPAWMVGVCNGVSRLAVSHIVQRCNPWNNSRIGVGSLVYSLRTTIVLWVSLVFVCFFISKLHELTLVPPYPCGTKGNSPLHVQIPRLLTTYNLTSCLGLNSSKACVQY
jgi:hypothetical protein